MPNSEHHKRIVEYRGEEFYVKYWISDEGSYDERVVFVESRRGSVDFDIEITNTKLEPERSLLPWRENKPPESLSSQVERTVETVKQQIDDYHEKNESRCSVDEFEYGLASAGVEEVID